MKSLLLFITLLIADGVYSQTQECGYKEQCECDTLNQSIEYSFKITALIFEGTIVEIDTIPISEILTPLSVSLLKKDTLEKLKCAKNVLKSEKVIKVKAHINNLFKGEIKKKEIYLLTPLRIESCGYPGFKLKNKYVIYATQNKTADIYFVWTLDKDYFHLKPEYIYWTNKCKRTTLSNDVELEKLREIMNH